jgi:5-methylcytosine-specific restriction enzyme A
VFKRDKGVCASCYLDTVKLDRAYKAAWYTASTDKAMDLVEERLEAMGFRISKTLWEVDHILPVADGGGLAGLNQLQTLCYPCHQQKTKKENKKRLIKKSNIRSSKS